MLREKESANMRLCDAQRCELWGGEKGRGRGREREREQERGRGRERDCVV